MVTKTFTEDTDNIKSRIIKEDKTNTDVLRLFVTNNSTIATGDAVVYKNKAGTTIFTGTVQNVKTGEGIREAIIWDKGEQLLRRTVNTIFTNQRPEQIIRTVIQNYTDLTYVNSDSIIGSTITT